MIDALKLVKPFIKVALARAGRPQDVPLVGVRVVEVIGLEDAAHELCVTFEKLIEHLLVLDVVASAGSLSGDGRVQELLLGDLVDMLDLIDGLHGGCVEILCQVHDRLLQIFICLVEEVLLGARLAVVAGRYQERVVVLQVAQRVEYFQELESACFLLLLLSGLIECPILVAEKRCAGAATKVSVDADPLRFELGLNHFEPIEWAEVVARPGGNGLCRAALLLRVSSILSRHLLLLATVSVLAHR